MATLASYGLKHNVAPNDGRTHLEERENLSCHESYLCVNCRHCCFSR